MENYKLRNHIVRGIAERGEIPKVFIEPIKIIDPILNKYLNELKFFTYGIERSIDKLIENPNILDPILLYFDYNEFNYYADSFYSEIKNMIGLNGIDAEKYAISCFNHCYECDKNLDFFLRNFYERVTKRAKRGEIVHDDFLLIAENIDFKIKNGVWLINSTLTEYLFWLIVDNFAKSKNNRIKVYVEKKELLNEYFDKYQGNVNSQGLATFQKLLIGYYEGKVYRQSIFGELSKDWGVSIDALERATKRLEKFKTILKGNQETKRIIENYIKDLENIRKEFIRFGMKEQVLEIDLDIKKLSKIERIES